VQRLFDMSEKIVRQGHAYRLRAEEVRTVADRTRDAQCRAALYRIAEGYERLARNLDQVVTRPEKSRVSMGQR